MFKRAEVEAWFTGCNIKAGKTTMQFELDQEYKSTLPDLALLTGTKVRLEIIDDQQVLFVSKETGEFFDEEEIDEAQEPDDAA